MHKSIILIFALLLAAVSVTAQSEDGLQKSDEQLQADFDHSATLMRQQRYDEAVRLLLPIRNDNTLAILRAETDNRLGYCYKHLGRYAEANTCFAEAMTLARPGTRQHEATTSNYAALLVLMGQTDKAISLLQQLPRTPKNLCNTAYAYATSDPLDSDGRAEELLDSALAVIAGNHANPNYAIALQTRGYIRWMQGRLHEAETDLRASLQTQSARHAAYHQTLGNLAIVLAEQGNATEAMKAIGQCERWQADRLGTSHPDYIITLRKRAAILLMTGRKNEAAQAYKAYFEKERSYVACSFSALDTQQRLNLWAKEKPLLSELFALENTAPDFLLDVALYRRAIALTGAVEGDEAQRLLTVSGNDIRRHLRTSEAGIDFVVYTKNGSKSAQRQAGAAGTKATGGRSTEWYGAIILQPGHPTQFVPLCSRDSLERLTTICSNGHRTPLVNAVTSHNAADKNGIYSDTLLARRFWQPLLSRIPKATDIYFAPDGLLHTLAIEHLPVALPPSRQLTLHRLTTLARLTKRTSSGKPTGKALVVGGLDYDDLQPLTADSATTGQPDHAAADYLTQEMPNWNFAYLKGTRQEADSITSLLQRTSAKTTQTHILTEESLKAVVADYSVLHFSTHGYALNVGSHAPSPFTADSTVYDRSLLASGLVLTGANVLRNDNTRDDGILSARELCDLQLQGAALTVVSACQTALGNISDEGPAGLVRGLKKAGAHAIVATLWEVDDEATMLFMTAFYRHLAEGRTHADAIRAAQLAVRTMERPARRFNPATLSTAPVFLDSNGKPTFRPTPRPATVRPFAAPYYWAAFMLIEE